VTDSQELSTFRFSGFCDLCRSEEGLLPDNQKRREIVVIGGLLKEWKQ